MSQAESRRTYDVLFLCTGNSARSILAEALLNHRGGGRFRAQSAGSHPTGQVNPLALELLVQARIPTAGLRSKNWNEFVSPAAFDFVITVCDRAAGETCPIWTGEPVTAHWSIDDPASAAGDEAGKRRAFHQAFRILGHRIGMLVELPLDSLDRKGRQRELNAIGRANPPSGAEID